MSPFNNLTKALYAVISAVIVLGLPENTRKDISNFLWEHTISIPLSFSIIATFALTYLIIFLYHLRPKRMKEKLQVRLAAAEHALDRAEKIQQMDLVTGIPNQYKFELDIDKIIKASPEKFNYQIAMIDLDNFRELNNRFGHQRGDEVMAFIARTIHNGMRRSEEVYKTTRQTSKTKMDKSGNSLESRQSLWRIYRKYSGGDEFLFLLTGGEPDAVGFLSRLADQLEIELEPVIDKQFLHETWKVGFHGGVCRLDADDTARIALGRVAECLAVARQPGSRSRVFWYSRAKASDFAGGSKEAVIYDRASKRFAKGSSVQRDASEG